MVLSMEYVLFSVAYEVNLVRFWYPHAMKWLNKSLIISLWSQTIPWKICVRVLKQWITRPNEFGPMTTRKGDTKPNKTVKGHKRPSIQDQNRALLHGHKRPRKHKPTNNFVSLWNHD